MRMPKKLKNRWIKALRSGEYGQADGTLCDGEGNFCCLGVLEHLAMDGECEVDEVGDYRDTPSSAFYEYAGIKIGADFFGMKDKDIDRLMEMNDTMTDDIEPTHENDFNMIADWIEKNVRTL